jgi:hypothetical protein
MRTPDIYPRFTWQATRKTAASPYAAGSERATASRKVQRPTFSSKLAYSYEDPLCENCGRSLSQDDGDWRDERGSALCTKMQYHVPVEQKTASRKTAISLTRQHFELIAGTIANSSLSASDKQSLAQDFASSLAATNNQFDHARFIDACTK